MRRRPPAPPGPLYHYACAHMATNVARAGRVVPDRQAANRITRLALDADPITAIVSRWCWFTDHSHGTQMWANILGLHDTLLACDQPVFRFKVTDRTRVVPFLVLLAQYPALTPLTKGKGDPLRWFVSWAPVPAVYDTTRRPVAYNNSRQRLPMMRGLDL